MSISPTTIAKFLRGEIEASALPEPAWGPIGKEVYQRTYSRDGEVWAETVRRVVQGSLSYVDESLWRENEDVKLFGLMYEFKALPAGRHLWVTGTKASTLSKNCWSASFGRQTSSHFKFLAERLFEGGGVGSNYSRDITRVMQPILSSVSLYFRLREDHPDFDDVSTWVDLDTPAPSDSRVILVPDTREGWVQTWVDLIDTVCESPTHTNIIIDVSDVRHYGAPLKTFGGTASGPTALVRSLIGINEVLKTAVGRQLSGVDAMLIDHEIACGVVAGGARRSARMSIMSWQDPEIMDFIYAKANSGSHWTTNISVEVDSEFREAVTDINHPSHELAQSVLDAVTAGMAANGEPGMLDTEYMSHDEPTQIRITNPCVTGDAWVQTTDGLRQVDELIGAGPVDLLVNDEVWSTGPQGFFKTGDKKTLTLSVDGTDLRVTPDHLISTPDGWRAAGELEVGDVVNLTDSLGNSWGGRGTRSEGYLVGHLIGDGFINVSNKNGAPGTAVLCAWHSDGGSETSKQHIINCINESGLEHRSDWNGWKDHGEDKQELMSAAIRDLAAEFGVVKDNKTITPEILSASSEFIIGVLQGLFDTDGHVEGSSTGGGLSVRLSQSNFELLSKVRVMLLSLGIKSAVRFMKDAESKKMPGGVYQTKDSYRLIVAGHHVERFSKVVGFIDSAKATKLTEGMASMTRGFYEKPMVGSILSVTESSVEAVYDCQVPGINAFVANGTVVHNCGEAMLVSHDTEIGVVGESCNLGSVDLDAFGTDFEGASEAFELMARFLYRATLNPHLDERASRIENNSRRIGVGIMGLQGWCAAHGVRLSDLTNNSELRDLLTGFRHRVRVTADEFADQLGTPRSVKVTAVAPTGTIAQLRGTQPGIHPVFARHFKRRVRYANSDSSLQDLTEMGYKIEDDIYTAQTSVVEFIVRDSILDRFSPDVIEQSDELDLAQFLGLIAVVQETFCGSGDGQSVSATAQIAPDTDPKELSNALVGFLGTVKGFTVFPSISRPQSPYESISQAEYEAHLGPVQMVGDSNSGECVGGSCPIR